MDRNRAHAPAAAASNVGALSDDADSLTGVSCTSPGICTAVGHYVDSSGSTQAMTATLSGGTWTATELVLPAGATTTAGVQDAHLKAVSCTSPGICTAVGYYVDSSASTQAITATLTGGTWTATELTLPRGAAGDQNARLNAVSCTGPGACATVGTYTDGTGIGGIQDLTTQAMTATLSGGTWTAARLTLPAVAEATIDLQADAPSLIGVSCTSPAICTAVGGYYDSSANAQAMITVSEYTLGVRSLSLPGASVAVRYARTLPVTGGSGSRTYRLIAGHLPAGLALDPATGVISGVPTSVGHASVTVAVADAGPPAQADTYTFGITTGLGITGLSSARPRSGSILRFTITGVARNQTITVRLSKRGISIVKTVRAYGARVRVGLALIGAAGRHLPRGTYTLRASTRRGRATITGATTIRIS